jgi:hypothetical protein
MSTFSGANRILTERSRQIDAEGYDTTHDAEHSREHLLLAAQAYLRVALTPTQPVAEFVGETVWPFQGGFKPTIDDVDKMLVKAGALIAAAIDRGVL